MRFKQTTQEATTRDKEERDQFEHTSREWDDLLKGINDRWEGQFDQLTQLYREQLRLKGPATYWEKIAKQYEGTGRKWVWAAVSLASVVGLAIALILYIPPKAFTAEKITAVGIGDAILLALAVSLFVYIMHLFVRLATSAYHLSRDAQERHQLTYVYLALIKEEAMKEEERNERTSMGTKTNRVAGA